MSGKESSTSKRRRRSVKKGEADAAVRSIAHDLNNILATISLYAELALQESDLSSLSQERLETICQQAEEGADLVQALRQLSRR